MSTVVIGCGAGIIARHPRSYDREDMVFDPIHYLPLLEHKIGALDQAAPLAGWELPDAFPTLRCLLEARMGKAGKREYVQVLRLVETFDLEVLHGAVKDALRLGAIGYDAVKHLVLCRIERRPPKLDLDIYPYLPRANVATTAAASYMSLLAWENVMTEAKLPAFTTGPMELSRASCPTPPFLRPGRYGFRSDLEHKIGALDQAAPLAGWELPDAFPTLRCLLEARMGKAGKREYARSFGLWRPSKVLHGAVKDALDRLRRRQTPCAVPYRATPAQTRPGYLSLPASGQRGDHGRRQLYELVGWRRVMTDTPQVLLAHHLKTLKLPTFLREYDKLARQCATEGADHVRYLVRLTELELIDRERRMVERRIRQARFPAVKSLDSFDFKAIASLNKMLVLELARCEYVERRENIIALGNSGTGKTHIALGLGLAACQKGLSVGFLTAAALVHELMEARDEKRLLRLQKQLAKYHLLIIDELGFVPLSKTGAELLFEVFSQRYERGSILVTSNLPFDEWTEIFGSERLTGALLDRLTHHVHILEMNGESYRLNQSQKRRKSPKIPA